MSGRLSPLIAVMVVVGILLAVPTAGLAAQPDTVTDAQPADESAATDTPPGAQLAGVVGVGEAEIDAEVDDRAFGIRIAQAASADAQADVVADRLGDVEQRLSELENEREELERARENGSMSEGEYRARAAKLVAETRATERAANQTADATAGLPADLLESKGIDVDAIRTLAQNASELTGPEVAEIARSIAGEGVGGPAAGDRTPFGDDGPVPDDAGPSENGPDGVTPGDTGASEDGADDAPDGNETRAPDDADASDGAGDGEAGGDDTTEDNGAGTDGGGGDAAANVGA